MSHHTSKILFGMVVLASVGIARAADISSADARAIAKEAYIFGVPMVDTYKTVYAFNVDKSNAHFKFTGEIESVTIDLKPQDGASKQASDQANRAAMAARIMRD